jgi:U3 small nucleolar RNA-associated protein 13
MPVFETLESVGIVELEEGEESKKGKEKEGAATRRAIYTGGDKGTIRLWDLLSGEQIKTKADESQTQDGKVHEILSIM